MENGGKETELAGIFVREKDTDGKQRRRVAKQDEGAGSAGR